MPYCRQPTGHLHPCKAALTGFHGALKWLGIGLPNLNLPEPVGMGLLTVACVGVLVFLCGMCGVNDDRRGSPLALLPGMDRLRVRAAPRRGYAPRTRGGVLRLDSLNVARTCLWTWFCTPRFFGDPHPNRTGYEKIGRTFARKLQPLLP